jgi:phosphatidylglycerophosphate synthase
MAGVPATWVQGDDVTNLVAFLREADLLRRSSERSQAMLWSRHVNRPIGAVIAHALLPSRVTPNMVSIVGSLLHLAGAVVVVLSPVPVPPVVALVAFVTWEFALALDNADGLLARARGVASPFGAWFDQILDFMNHTAVIAALVVVAARTVPLSGPEAAILGTLALAGNLVGLFASAQRNALLGTEPALGEAEMSRLRPLLALRHLTDYGLFIAVASVGLLWPPLLLAALIVSPGLSAALVAGQVAINWPRG